MKKVFASSTLKSLVAACAVSATALGPLASAPAAADGWHHGGGKNCFYRHGQRYCSVGPRHPRPVRRDNGGDAAAAAVIGLAGAAILLGAMQNSAPPTRTYRVAPSPYPPAPARGGPRVITYESRLQPWSPEWYRWCDARYRSFNPQTGTFRGYDGLDHFCVPK